MDSFVLNSKIEMITEDNNKTIGTIYDVIDDKLHVSVISDDKKIKLLYVGDMVGCVIFGESGGISFDATVSQRISDPTPIYELSDIRNIAEVRRRQDVRVDHTMEVLYSYNKSLLKLEKSKIEELNIDEVESLFHIGTTSDLSGGGLKFTCYNKIDSNDIIFFLDIEDDDLFVKGTIVSEYIKLSPRGSLYTYCIKFIDITEKEKDRIIKFLFVLMRRNRLK